MKKLLLLVVIVLLISAGSYFVFNLAKPKTPSVEETPTVQKPELEKNTVLFKQETGFAVGEPVVNREYTISYDGPFKSYSVIITAKTIDEYRQTKLAAEKEFKDKGVSDLCTLKILFVVPKEVLDQANQSDNFATGCKSYL